ncbi:MAG TPA: hypothetical protein VIY48_15245 [Candidatus Paceibacterota bacterium]
MAGKEGDLKEATEMVVRWVDDHRTACGDCKRMTDLIVRLHVDGVLSEGQAAKATGLDRVALRIRADNVHG